MLRILLVDDENDAFFLSESIKQGDYDIKWERVDEKEEYISKLDNNMIKHRAAY